MDISVGMNTPSVLGQRMLFWDVFMVVTMLNVFYDITLKPYSIISQKASITEYTHCLSVEQLPAMLQPDICHRMSLHIVTTVCIGYYILTNI
jgi:hypothetical protein